MHLLYSAATHFEQEMARENESSSPSSRLAERLLQNSEKVLSGSPSVYKLPMKTEFKHKESMIARQSIGSGSSHRLNGKAEKVFMVVGATGTGKTTLINGLINYIMGVEWKDDFRYKLIIEDQTVSQGQCQTKDITAYTFYPMEGSTVPYTFTIIDTPGFGDSEELEKDRTIKKQIKEFLSMSPPEGIDHLDGIGFVTQASLARLTPRQEYIFNFILSIFGKDVVKNIFTLATFADCQPVPPVMEAINKANIPSQKYYKFNNLALFADNAEETEDMFNEVFWKMGVSSFKTFFAEIEKSVSVSLQLTKEVLKESEHVRVLIGQLDQQITMGLRKTKELRQEELVLQQHTKAIEANKEFTYTVQVTKPRKIDLSETDQLALTCLKCSCTCLKNCPLGDNEDKHNCDAFDTNGNCKVCVGHCHWSSHESLPYLLEYETVDEIKTSEDLKMNYDKAVSSKTQTECTIKQLTEDIQCVETEVITMKNQIQQILCRLDKIALKPSPLMQLQYLEQLIKSEKMEANPGWMQRVQYYEEVKRQAEIWPRVKDVDARQMLIKDTPSSGDKRYS